MTARTSHFFQPPRSRLRHLLLLLLLLQAHMILGFLLPTQQQLGPPQTFLSCRRTSTVLAKEATTTTTTTTTASADDALGKTLQQAGTASQKLDLKSVFEALTAPGSRFMDTYWQQQPCFTATVIPPLAEAWTMADMEEAVAKEFLLAGRGFFDETKKGGWKMAAVGEARGSSFEEAKLRPEDVRAAMAKRSGTVVFNSVGGSVAPLAGVCLDAVESFRLPVALNLYLTAPGQATSAPPHTDKQDVFVLQSQGRKRWRVYAPPAPCKKPGVDPFARGKDADILTLDELGPPLIDTVLGPGQVLYMPAGFPHTTDTVVGMTDEKDPSVHLTLGVDTHIWGLTHANLRDYLLFRLNPTATTTVPAPPPSTEADATQFVKYHSQLPLGAREAPAAPEASIRWSDVKKVLAAGVEAEFMAVMQAVADPALPVTLLEDANTQETLAQVVERVIDHHRSITAVFRAMYSDVKYGLSEVPRDLSCFRSQPYYQNIENTMQALVEWAAPPMQQAADSQPVAASGAGGGGGGGATKGGFGGATKKPASGKGGKKKK